MLKGMNPFLIQTAIVFLSCAPSIHAQVSSGWIEGRVRNPSRQGIEGVYVLAAKDGRGLPVHALTNSAGDYRFVALPPGTYALEFRKPGYAPGVVTGVIVESGGTSFTNVQMQNSSPTTKTSFEALWPGKPEEPWAADYGSVFDQARLAVLPSARNIWAALENQEPSTITNAPEEGGFTTGIIALAGVLGSSWTQNAYRLDGINVTDPFDTGKPLVFPDPSSLQEIQTSAALHSAELGAPGGSFNMTSREGGQEFHFGAETYYLGKPFQSSNLDGRLRGLGYSTVPHFNQFGEGEFSLSGHVPRTGKKWFFFATLGIQDLTKSIPDFSSTPQTTVRSALVRFDGRLSPRDQFALMSTDQIVNNSNLDAGPGIAPSATLRGHDRFEVVQGHWTHYRSSDFMWQVLGGFSHASPTDTIQRGVNDAARIDLFTGNLAGAAPLESDSARSRFSLVGQGQRRLDYLSWAHLLDFGFDLEESKSTEERRVLDGFQQLYFPAAVPSEVIEYNSPSHSKQRLRELSFYVEDRLKIASRIFLRAGLQLDSSNAFLPPQESLDGAFVPVRKFAGAASVISWTTLSPRIGLGVPVSNRFGGTRISGGYSRYYHLLPSSYANFANPTSLSGQVFLWNDRNGDGLFQRGEEGTMVRVFGGSYSSVDPHLKRPFTDELVLGLDQNVGSQLTIGIRGFRRIQNRLVQSVNVGVPAASYTPVSIADPGDDNIPGTSDDRVLTVFNQDPRTLGQDRYLLTNPPGLRSAYRGLEATIRANLARHGFVSISFAAFKAVGQTNPGNTEFENDPGVIGSLFESPNSLLNAQGRIFFDRAYVSKIASCIRLPLGFYSGSVIKYADGLPFGRKLVIAGLNQGPFLVMATPRGQPGGFRTQFDLSFDQRLARDFSAGRYRISLMIDVFNLINRSNSLREFDISGPLFPLRKPTEIQNPRVVRLGLRLNL